MLYSKKQRREIYQKALDFTIKAEKNHILHYGFVCNAIEHSSKISDDIINESSFPELFLFKRDDAESISWLSGVDDEFNSYANGEDFFTSRQQVLMFCIEMTK